jgi:hypothetical protein
MNATQRAGVTPLAIVGVILSAQAGVRWALTGGVLPWWYAMILIGVVGVAWVLGARGGKP